jgi:hypothetical protein
MIIIMARPASGGGEPPSAADLKFLHDLQDTHQELQIEKRHSIHKAPGRAGRPMWPGRGLQTAGLAEACLHLVGEIELIILLGV